MGLMREFILFFFKEWCFKRSQIITLSHEMDFNIVDYCSPEEY